MNDDKIHNIVQVASLCGISASLHSFPCNKSQELKYYSSQDDVIQNMQWKLFSVTAALQGSMTFSAALFLLPRV